MPAECPWCAADGREGCPDHVDRHLLRGVLTAVGIETLIGLLVVLAIIVAVR